MLFVANACAINGQRKSPPQQRLETRRSTSSIDSHENYILRYQDIAVEEMKRTGIPASIKLAQGILESSAGRSHLSLVGNNHFGVKCQGGWQGGSIYRDDDRKNECFRMYRSAGHSFRDHSDFLKRNSRYERLFQLDPCDYQGWARGLEKAGYATAPGYAQKVIQLIEQYQLYLYDRQTMQDSSPEKETTSDKLFFMQGG